MFARLAIVPTLVTGVLLCLAPAGPAPAAMVGEMSFRNLLAGDGATAGSQTSIADVKTGASAVAELRHGSAADASVRPSAPTGLGPEFDTDVRIGYLNIPGRSSGGVRPINTDPGGNNAQLRDYMGPGYSSPIDGSVAVVFKPNYSGVVSPRRAWFVHKDGNFNGAIMLFISDNIDGPEIRLGRSGDNQSRTNLPNFSWDPSKWYMIAASWAEQEPSPGSITRTTKLYVRELSTLVTSATTATDTVSGLIDVGDSYTSPWYVGARDNVAETADGRIALFQMFDTALDFDGFDTVYESLFAVPEPSALVLVLAVAAGILLRDRNGRLG